MKNALKFSFCLVITLLANTALAKKTVLPDIVVTATRTPVAVDKVPAAVTVFTSEDIEGMQVKTLPELLKGSLGVDITQNGQFGKTTSVFIRGTESDHVLVLINGIRVSSATLGTAAFQFFPIDQIERVEIVRGPHSSIYGSEAIGGVIQIFTRKGEGHPRLSGHAGGGSFSTYEVAGTAGGEYKDTDFNLTVSRFDTQGFDARDATTGPFGVNQPDDDGYENTSVGFRLGHRFGDKIEVDTFLLRAWGTTEFDGNVTDETDFVQQVVGGSARIDPLDFWRSTLRVGQNRDESENFAPTGETASEFDTTRWEVIWQNGFTLAPEHLLTLGADFRDESIDSSENFLETSRSNVGVFGQYAGSIGGNELVGSVRWDDNEAFGNEVTGSAGWSYNWDNGIRVLAMFGTAFKAPNFNELYFPNFGNPNLDAETSKSYEVGIEGRHEWWHWGVRAYRTDIEDLISFVSNPQSPFGISPENVDKARIDGLEVQGGLSLSGWDVSLEFNLLDPENRDTGNRLPRRSEKTVKFDLSRQIGKFNVGGTVIAQGDRFDDADNTNKVGGYAVVDLRAAYELTDSLFLEAKLANLLDKDYETIDTFNQADRNFFITLHYRPG